MKSVPPAPGGAVALKQAILMRKAAARAAFLCGKKACMFRRALFKKFFEKGRSFHEALMFGGYNKHNKTKGEAAKATRLGYIRKG